MTQKLLRQGALYAALLSLSACLSLGGGGPKDGESLPADGEAPGVELGEGDYLEVGELPGQSLAAGECGLFLFAAQPTARFVFFSNANKGIGRMKINGETITMIRTETGGGIIDQSFTEQSFSAPAKSLTVNLSIEPGKATDGGTRIRKAALRLLTANGWSMVMPVAGATSCQSG